jgi:hypothetical protein
MWLFFFLGGGFYFGILWPPQKKTKLNGEADGRCPNDVRKTNSDVINRTLYRNGKYKIKEIQNSNWGNCRITGHFHHTSSINVFLLKNRRRTFPNQVKV